MTDPKRRCREYIRSGCRAKATNSVRIGAHVYAFCDDPKHAPTKATR